MFAIYSKFFKQCVPTTCAIVDLWLVVQIIVCISGAPALTTRGFKEEDFKAVVGFLDESIKIAVKAQEKTGRNDYWHRFKYLRWKYG